MTTGSEDMMLMMKVKAAAFLFATIDDGRNEGPATGVGMPVGGLGDKGPRGEAGGGGRGAGLL